MIVTHDQIEALTIADRIAVMRDGIIEQVASPHDIFARPSNAFVAGFIGTPQMNLIEARLIRAEESAWTVHMLDQKVALPVGGGIASRRRGKKNGVLTVGVRPRGLALSAEGRPGHDLRPDRSGRADGSRDPDPSPDRRG